MKRIQVFGLAYTSGGMKLGIINNTKDNAEGAAGDMRND